MLKVNVWDDWHWVLNNAYSGCAHILIDGCTLENCYVWLRGGYIHREDGPALIFPDGEECWYLNEVVVESKYGLGYCFDVRIFS